ncbi:MAG TPA: pantoate--beta-alanine ligase, partial [Candidatus Limnocylindria bacterium]|nr:pantoate--beta-alanine ligase [Candidatus Limnocylindria bacterium]
MYPGGARATLAPAEIAEPLEGRARPGHFAGVVTVVARLFDVVRPDAAYFGQKDFQQLRVIQVTLGPRYPGLRIIGCPTVREPDGLAMSSRNAYLTREQRRDALALSGGLFAARDAWERGERHPVRLANAVRRHVDRPDTSVRLEYVSAADPFTLAELRAPADRIVLSLAARVGKARLIDNVLLGMDVSALS